MKLIECLKEVSTFDTVFSILKKQHLTIVVSTASCEHSFSSLKEIKSYLWPTMTEECLVDLATLSIEKDLAWDICLD